MSGMPCEGEVHAIVRLQVHNRIPLEYQKCLICIPKTHAKLPVPSALNMRLTSDVYACEVLLVCWTYAARDSMFAYPTTRTRDASTDPGQFIAKKALKIVIGHLRLSQAHSARKRLMGCGSRHGANGMLLSFPSLFRNGIKARTYVRSSTHYTAAQATTTWTPCISCAYAGTRLTNKPACLTTEEGRGYL